MAPHAGTQILRDRTALFDGEIGNAFVGIEPVWIDERVSGAGVDAAGARTAAVRSGQVWREIQRCENHS